MAHRVGGSEIRLIDELGRDAARWLTVKELAAAAGLSRVATRSHTARLVGLGVLEESKAASGGYRYRPHPSPAASAREYLARVEEARAVLGVALAAH